MKIHYIASVVAVSLLSQGAEAFAARERRGYPVASGGPRIESPFQGRQDGRGLNWGQMMFGGVVSLVLYNMHPSLLIVSFPVLWLIFFVKFLYERSLERGNNLPKSC